MSKSYKHTPYYGDRKNRGLKRIANRLVRRKLKKSNVILSRGAYRKMFDSWEICDFCYIEHNFETFYTKEVSIWNDWGYKYEPYPTREEKLKEYNKYYIRK